MSDILVSDFIILLLIFFRILSAFVSAPIFSNEVIPVISKIFIAFLIAYVIFSFIDKSQINIEYNTWFLASNLIKEIIIGLTIGFSMNIVFFGINFAGSLMSFDIGLSAAQLLNPLDGSQSDAIGNVLFYMAVLVFLLINGHHYLIQSLYSSFKIVPLGKYVINQPVYDLLMKYSFSVFIIAIKIASPILVSFFLVHIAEGIMSRVIPQMQVFFVTQPLKIGLGFGLLAVAVPTYLYVLKGLLGSYEESLFKLLKAMS